jgi:hypothetical protein
LQVRLSSLTPFRLAQNDRLESLTYFSASAVPMKRQGFTPDRA